MLWQARSKVESHRDFGGPAKSNRVLGVTMSSMLGWGSLEHQTARCLRFLHTTGVKCQTRLDGWASGDGDQAVSPFTDLQLTAAEKKNLEFFFFFKNSTPRGK